MKNGLKEKFLRGEKALGTFVWMGGASAVEALSYTGLDFVVIDNEHGPFEAESTQEMVRAANLGSVTPCVRIKEVTRTAVLKQLDIGAEAIIVPDVRGLDEVKDLVRFAKYHPLGQRGVAFARAAGYGYADHAQQGLQHYFDTSNAETLLIPQCETKESVECIDGIVALDGVDGVFVGPYDLSASLGVPGDFGAPMFKEALETVFARIKEAGKLLMVFTFSKEEARAYFERGADAVVYSADVNVMVDAFRRDVRDVLG